MTASAVESPVLDAFLNGDAAGVVAACAAGVVVDVNIPTWRFQLQGRDALRRLLESEEFLPGRSVATWRSATTDDGLLLELETHAPIHGEERLWRELVWFRGAPGAITEVTVFCSGIWDAATIARQAAEAPMVAR